MSETTDTKTTNDTGTDSNKNLQTNSSDSNPPATTDSKALSPVVAKASANPFKAIAMVLASVRVSLENPKEEGKAPRWIRMVRIREFQGDSDYISKAVIPVLGGLNTAMWFLMDLTLKAKDMLAQADAAKAMWEVSSEMLTVVASDDFSTAIAQVINPDAGKQTSPLSGIRDVIGKVDGFVDRIPSPEDLELLGNEFFRLLSVELLPLDATDLNDKTELHLNLNTTGKLRLIQMGLGKSMTVRGLGADKGGTQDITYLGSRRLIQGSTPAPKALLKWGSDPKKLDTVYEFTFTGTPATGTEVSTTTPAKKEDGVGADLIEAHNLLDKLGYPAETTAVKNTFDEALAKRLRTFQKLNGLVVNGKLDNSTINRLMHFNFETKSIERAVAYNATKLPEGFDNSKNEPVA